MKRKLTSIAKKLRKEQTPQEMKLWKFLRSRGFGSLKFRRQWPIGNCVVDFCCSEKKLIIELDGGQHNEKVITRRDLARDKYLKNKGFKILRVWNNEVQDNLEGIFDKVDELVGE